MMASPTSTPRCHHLLLLAVLLLVAGAAPSNASRALKQAGGSTLDISVDCSPGNTAINNAIGQSFFPTSTGFVDKISIWIKPNLYYVSSYELQLWSGEFGALLATSPRIDVNPSSPASWQNLTPGAATFYDFAFPASTIEMAAGAQYSWKLVRISSYSGAFAKCGNVINGNGFWLGYSKEYSSDYTFKFYLQVAPPTPAPTASPPSELQLAANPAFCVNDYRFAESDGGKVNLWQCNGHLWTHAADGSLQLSANTNFCLGVNVGSAIADGAVIDVSTCNGSDIQKWTYDALAKTMNLKASPGFCLNQHYFDQRNDGVINLWSCNGHDSQKWQLV